MNKKGAQNAMIWVVIVLVVGFLLFQQGFFETPEAPPSGGDGGQALPSDLQTTITMSFKDELATSETAVSSALWYAFNGDGTYFNSGTASSGTATLTGNVQSTYDIWAYTTGESGYIAKKTTINTGNKPNIAKTISLIKRGGLEITATDDPIDLDQNITGSAGATEEFRVKWKVNVSNAASLAPIMLLETNDTSHCIEDVTISTADNKGGSWTEITCPDRTAASVVGHKLYCFKRDKMAYATDGTLITSVMIKFDSTTSCGDEDWIQAQLADTGMYLEAGYDSISGVKFDAENDANSDVGAGDSNTKKTHFND
jgi:hypothetical protein